MAGKREASIVDLLADATGYLRGLGYAEGTIERHRRHWRSFADYARKQQTRRFCPALAARFLRTLPSTRGRPYWHRSHTVRHSMRILIEFAASGRHRPRYALPRQQLPAVFEQAITDTIAFAEGNCGWAQSTLTCRSAWIGRFVRHVIARRAIRMWKDLSAADVVDYLGSLQIARGSRATVLGHLKAMCRILFIRGVLPMPLHEKTPPFARSYEAALSTVWLPAEAEAILKAVDRETAIGKRNYAVLLLAMRLGLRSCDIRNLCLDDLRWEQSCIEIVQQKTQSPLALPLLPEIGDAMIDYLRNGRPRGRFREVFLRHTAPCGPLRTYDFRSVLQACCRKAGLPQRRRAGMSSLRHTLATRMLEDGTSVETIAGVLGHACVETTRRYIRVDIPLLRQAALDPEKEVAHA